MVEKKVRAARYRHTHTQNKGNKHSDNAYDGLRHTINSNVLLAYRLLLRSSVFVAFSARVSVDSVASYTATVCVCVYPKRVNFKLMCWPFCCSDRNINSYKLRLYSFHRHRRRRRSHSNSINCFARQTRSYRFWHVSRAVRNRNNWLITFNKM